MTYGLECALSCGNCSDGKTCHHDNGTCWSNCDAGVQGDRCQDGESYFGWRKKLINIWTSLRTLLVFIHEPQQMLGVSVSYFFAHFLVDASLKNNKKRNKVTILKVINGNQHFYYKFI